MFIPGLIHVVRMFDADGERVGVLLAVSRDRSVAEAEKERWQLEMAVQNPRLLKRFEDRGLRVEVCSESLDDVYREVHSREFQQAMNEEQYRIWKEAWSYDEE